MNYLEAIDYIHSIDWTFCKPGLSRIKLLLEKLNNPQNSLKFIHVAGTNGKGSFCKMLEKALSLSGYKTGLFTSPYIKVFNERIQISGKMIEDDELALITDYVRPFADEMTDKPTEFELITAIGLEYFKRQKCDIVILEAGMGGKLDSTNIISTSILSVITGIALDHTQFLGNTVEKIAKEKAGIIKKNIPVLFGGEDGSAKLVIKDAAKENSSPFFDIDYNNLYIKEMTLQDTIFDYKNHKNMHLSLLGEYQPKNASLVIEATEILYALGYKVSRQALKDAFKTVSWPARFEIINTSPLVIFDGAHNPQGIDVSVKSIKAYFKDKKVLVMTGVLKDKDYFYIADRLKEITDIAFVFTPENPRALNKEDYAKILKEKGINALTFGTIKEAYNFGLSEAKRLDLPLIILGSLYTYAYI